MILDEQWLVSWQLHLQAERRSPRTIKVYLDQAHAFLRWADRTAGTASLDKFTIRRFLADESLSGLAGTTVRARHNGLRQLCAWLVGEGELEVNPLDGIRRPSVTVTPPPVLTEEHLRALVGACKGGDFRDRRDMAALRLLIDTGARASEIADLRQGDVNLPGAVVTLRGKGDRIRVVPFGVETARAVDRYLRVRRSHPFAELDALWLGLRGAWTYDGLSAALERRAVSAGLVGFHTHLLRHTLAHRWLAAGGSEQGLMDVAGWRSREMLARYGASARAERAAAEHRRLALGDDL